MAFSDVMSQCLKIHHKSLIVQHCERSDLVRTKKTFYTTFQLSLLLSKSNLRNGTQTRSFRPWSFRSFAFAFFEFSRRNKRLFGARDNWQFENCCWWFQESNSIFVMTCSAQRTFSILFCDNSPLFPFEKKLTYVNSRDLWGI